MQNTTLLNTIGLSINAIGGLMMFLGTPPIKSGVWLFQDSEMKEMYKKDKLKNKVIRLGFAMLSLGTIIQLFALWRT